MLSRFFRWLTCHWLKVHDLPEFAWEHDSVTRCYACGRRILITMDGDEYIIKELKDETT